ncbi:hypothetical protein [Aquihabitans sp. McL0605]|uniref:hypothetical protein n=1 Tax=Aquihabitans sp. McL0605 TaxID=3415671 RepID=UPI003CEA91D9
MSAWVDLGQRGVDYVRARLDGGLALSKAAVDLTDLDAGTAVAWFPENFLVEDADPAQSTQLARSSSLVAMTELVCTFFNHVPSGSLWVEEPLPRKSDSFRMNPDVLDPPQDAWFFGEEVFSLAFDDFDDNAIRQAIQEIYDYPGWGGAGFLVNDTSPELRETSEIPTTAISEAAAGIEAVVCGAFDGDGYLVWRPESGIVATLAARP